MPVYNTDNPEQLRMRITILEKRLRLLARQCVEVLKNTHDAQFLRGSILQLYSDIVTVMDKSSCLTDEP